MFISEPKEYTGEKPLVYYAVITWEDTKSMGKTAFCEYASEAIRAAENAVTIGISAMSTVREEIVYKRTATCEISTSEPILHYERETDGPDTMPECTGECDSCPHRKRVPGDVDRIDREPRYFCDYQNI